SATTTAAAAAWPRASASSFSATTTPTRPTAAACPAPSTSCWNTRGCCAWPRRATRAARKRRPPSSPVSTRRRRSAVRPPTPPPSSAGPAFSGSTTSCLRSASGSWTAACSGRARAKPAPTGSTPATTAWSGWTWKRRTPSRRRRPGSGLQLDLQGCGRAPRLLPGLVDAGATRQGDGDAPVPFDHRLAEQAQGRVGFGQGRVHAGELRHAMAMRQHRAAGRRPAGAQRGNRQAEDGAGMQGELAVLLRDQGHQTGVVRPRRDLAEPDLVALHEQLDTEHTPAAEIVGDGAGDALRFRQRLWRHGRRQPALAVVAGLLPVADRVAEQGSVAVAHRQQGDLVIEVDEALDDAAAAAGAAAGLGVVPGVFDVGLAAHRALA